MMNTVEQVTASELPAALVLIPLLETVTQVVARGATAFDGAPLRLHLAGWMESNEFN